ncbi:MAG: MAPEG family protein [Rhodocyclaceae bacterium]|nr:MAPEG family protein [Rhodocyclaceae bacterium]
MTPTLAALTGFIAWTLFLLVAMEAIRSRMVITKEVPANGFRPDNANLSPFMQRLARAHANCLEGLPIFGGLMLVAVVSGKSSLTDPLAFVLLGARIVQSTIHLASLSPAAVTFRFSAFAVQMGIGVYWVFLLLSV